MLPPPGGRGEALHLQVGMTCRSRSFSIQPEHNQVFTNIADCRELLHHWEALHVERISSAGALTEARYGKMADRVTFKDLMVVALRPLVTREDPESQGR